MRSRPYLSVGGKRGSLRAPAEALHQKTQNNPMVATMVCNQLRCSDLITRMKSSDRATRIVRNVLLSAL